MYTETHYLNTTASHNCNQEAAEGMKVDRNAKIVRNNIALIKKLMHLKKKNRHGERDLYINSAEEAIRKGAE